MNRLHEAVAGNIDAQVDHLETRSLEHDHHQFLSDIVDVAGDGPHHETADGVDSCSHDQRADQIHHRLHGMGRHQHLGEEHLAGLEQAAHLLQRRDHGIEEEGGRFDTSRQPFPGHRHRLLGVAVEHMAIEAIEDVVGSTHPVPVAG